MRKDRTDNEFDKLIRESVKLSDTPSPELNNRIKAMLYQQEAQQRKEEAARSLSLWYLPMILNLITFVLLAVCALLVITNPYLAYLAAGVCLYMGLAGIGLTVAGIRKANLKEEITIRIEKRGALS